MEKFKIGDEVYLDFGISGIIPNGVIIAIHDFGNYSLTSYDIDLVVKECENCGKNLPGTVFTGVNARVCFVESQFVKPIK
jgi:hypothetical protein